MPSTALQVVIIALISSLTFVSLTKLPSSQLASYFPYYTGHAFNPGSVPLLLAPAGTVQQYPMSDGIERAKGLGLSDLVLFAHLTTRISQLEEMVKELTQELREPTTIGGMPTSCDDLRKLGNIKSGFYNIKSASKVGTVFCDFMKSSTDSDFQQWIGYVDVKSTPVYFFFKKGSYTTVDRERLKFLDAVINAGNAMNGTEGVFTAPLNGTYFFSFTGDVDYGVASASKTRLEVELLLNNGAVARTMAAETNTANYQMDTIHLEATLNLVKGDKIDLIAFHSGGPVVGGSSFSRFTGMLLEENIFPSI